MKALHRRSLAMAGVLLASASNACSDGTSPTGDGAAGAAGTAGSAASSTAGSAGAGTLPTGAAGSADQAGNSSAAGSTSTGGSGGAPGAGTGGVPGGAGGSGGVAGAQGGSAGSGGSADGWVDIFNGHDLSGWVPLIHKWTYNEDPYKTFRADPTNKLLRVTYEDYPGQSFDDHCGLLYYNKALTDYRVRVTYRFREPQAKNPVSWGKNNTGLMLFGIDPAKVTGDPEFPPLIEVQLLGTPSAGGSNNANLCQPGGMFVSKMFGEGIPQGGGCRDSKSGTAPAADQWVTVEAEVHVSGDTNVYQCVHTNDQPCAPDLTKPVLTISGPTYNGQPVTSGFLSLQSESQPVDFKDIQLKELK
jgi:hypothetical protein